MSETSRSNGGSSDFDKLAETNHRIANHLAMLGGLVNLQARQLRAAGRSFDASEAFAMFAGIDAKLQAVARLHRALAQPERGVAQIELASYLGDIVSTTVESLAAPGSLHLTLAIDADCRAEARDALHIALIACEIVTNSIKYAHPAGVDGRLHVACCKHGPDLVLDIEDDGVGLPADIDPLTDGNVGFRAIRALVAELGGSMTFASSELGLVFTLKVPQPAATDNAACATQVLVSA